MSGTPKSPAKRRPSYFGSIVNVRIYYGGNFKYVKNHIEYVGEGIELICGILHSKLKTEYLRQLCENLFSKMGGYEGGLEMWYKVKGKTLSCGKTLLVSDSDIANLLETKDLMNFVNVYVIKTSSPTVLCSPSTLTTNSPLNKTPYMVPGLTSQFPNISKPLPAILPDHTFCNGPLNKKTYPKAQKSQYGSCGPSSKDELMQCPSTARNNTFSAPRQKVSIKNSDLIPLRRSPRQHNISLSQNYTVSLPLPTNNISNPQIPFEKPLILNGRGVKLIPKRKLNFKDAECEVVTNQGQENVIESGFVKEQDVLNSRLFESGCLIEHGKGKGRVVESVCVREQGKGKSVEKDGAVKEKSVNNKGKGKSVQSSIRDKGKTVADVDESEDGTYTYLSDFDDGFNAFEEYAADVDDLFLNNNEHNDLLKSVEKTLEFKDSLWGVDELDVTVEEDIAEDSEELRSLHGSDDEIDSNPLFNRVTDFKSQIVLKLGLRFPNIQIFRKALQHHSIENGYDFYYLHNGRNRATAYCKKRCECVWDKARSKLGHCNCKEGKKCLFKVHATRIKFEDTFQIKSINLKHECGVSKDNTKVTAEYLAERYLEFWRCNMDWKVKSFQALVQKDLNVEVSYIKCWEAKTRAKLMIEGNGKEQYAKVWEYASAIRKFNPGSTTIVVCDGIDNPPVYFKRMYICLKACKDGFINGCRPILGVDGCHLRGEYTGMCLVAVANDGNNNIFPVAWAVVEAENTQSWTWFMELLASDIGADEGKGLTFMSDRQKGLIEALARVVPKAEVRYCVRHIWANFKLNFSGQVYKDSFWKAAKSTTKAEFDHQMEGIKLLSTEAWNYLNNIPPRHWSRHAFDTTCKSNMSTNNLCETFNSVLKEARTKPILTHMEWMRRYIMQRMCEKREGADKLEGKHMPFVKKYLKWAVEEARHCEMRRSSIDVYEVDYKHERVVVKLKERTCTCYNWDLTGLPCPHAIGCILIQRLDPEDFVHEFYTKAKYQATYEPAIQPMPGSSQWESIALPEPLPPKDKKLPGRPSSKKRRKEAGEKETHKVKRVKKPNKCSKCGELGHNKSTCNKVPAPPKPANHGGRPPSTTAWAKDPRQKKEKRKAQKAAFHQQLLGQGSATQPSAPFNESQASTTSVPDWATM